MATSHSGIAVSFFGMLLCAPITAQVTQRVSLDSSGAQGNGDSTFLSLSAGGSLISADGRFVAFASVATNLVPGDTNELADIFVRDRQSGTTERANIGSGGEQSNGQIVDFSISADCRYVAFSSNASILVPGDTNGSFDVFVRDRQSGTTERVSVDSSGVQGNGYSTFPSISADGRYVAFMSYANNLVSGDGNGGPDIFLHDRQSGTTERVSEYASSISHSSISADGRYVAFNTYAPLVSGETNYYLDVFVRDRQSGTTERVSVASSGAQGNDHSGYSFMISADGRCVTFSSSASNLVPGDTNVATDVFVRDRQLGTTELVSVASGGAQGNGHSEYTSISADGRWVAFRSFASNLVPGDTNGASDIFVHDRQSGTTERVSVDSSGAQSSGQGEYLNERPGISADGRYALFESAATNLVPGDTNGYWDVFVRDRSGGTTFASLCDPGVGGVVACPCSNPPSGPDRGCDNSAATGGASLSASGGTYLSSDSLVFTTSGEKPTALSTVWQGSTSPATGIVYGQGVRCVNGSLKRLYSKSAVGGSITAPNFGAGDATVSARSATLGVPITPGTSRYYFVSYRDPVVLGSCPAGSTFNATQTGLVGWSP